jgi:hypothetical protein
VGVLALAPSWLPLLRNLDQFITSRDVICIAERGMGAATFWRSLVHPSVATFSLATLTIVGAGLLVFLPRRWWFVVGSLIVLCPWLVLGLPRALCSVPLLSGARFERHLLPHVQMLFIFAVAVAVHGLAERLDRKWPWVVFAAACLASAALAIGTDPVYMRARVLGRGAHGDMRQRCAGAPSGWG